MKRTLLALAAMLALAGCANYQLGTTLARDLRPVLVPSVRNESSEPGVDSLASSAILREIQREGTLILSSEDQAATRLDITIVRFRLEPIRYQRDDTRAPDEYRATVVADVAFTRISDGKVLYSGAVEGDTTFPIGSDLVSAKQDMMPKAIDDLARKVIDRCISIW